VTASPRRVRGQQHLGTVLGSLRGEMIKPWLIASAQCHAYNQSSSTEAVPVDELEPLLYDIIGPPSPGPKQKAKLPLVGIQRASLRQ
jgi:hypothetical protein